MTDLSRPKLSRGERKIRHAERMRLRDLRRREDRLMVLNVYRRPAHLGGGIHPPIFANLSRRHPDHGLHPLEHAARKAARNG